MKVFSLITAATLLLERGSCVQPSLDLQPQPFGFFVNNTIYQPVGNETVTYPRYVELTDGTLIATTSIFGRDPASFPIFESKDGGATWKYISNLTDEVNGWGMSVQPALVELTEPLGGFDTGTILASGNSASDNGTRIELYASTDRARTWKFVSHIAMGGKPNTTNGADPIWEPYLLYVIPTDKEMDYSNSEIGCTITLLLPTTVISVMRFMARSWRIKFPRT